MILVAFITAHHSTSVRLLFLHMQLLIEEKLKIRYCFFCRSYLKDKEIFNVAVPIKIAIHKKHKNATRILLLCTNCDKNTRQIDWRKLGLHEIDHSWFKDIRWAEKLFLLYNMLTTIPGNVIDLHKLCRLDLQNNQLTRIPSGLLKMNCLRTLNLSCNKLTELPKKCDWSPSLNTLDLSDNLLDSLPKNMGRAKLKTLSIARNSFYDVPACVCEILTLGKLDLSGNRNLRELPKEMGRLTEIFSLKLDNLDQVSWMELNDTRYVLCKVVLVSQLCDAVSFS